MSLCVRKPTIWVPTRSDTNRAVQLQKMVRGWKFWIKKKRKFAIRVAKTKALISCAVSYCTVYQRLSSAECYSVLSPFFKISRKLGSKI